MDYYNKYKTYKHKYKKLQSKIKKTNLVTLKNYLADELSKGPKEDKGSINYSYLSNSNFYFFFMILILDKKIDDKIVCKPHFDLMSTPNFKKNEISPLLTTRDIEYASFKINFKLPELYYDYFLPKDFLTSIKICKFNKRRLLYIPLVIALVNRNNTKQNSHFNVIIFDFKMKTVERFEPYGRYLKNSKKIDDDTNNILINIIKNKLKLNDFTYIPPSKISTKIEGIQSIADSFCGMCLTISMLYLHMRILNLNVKQHKIVDYFLELDKLELKNMILKYAKYIEKTLKNNSILINKYKKQLIYDLNTKDIPHLLYPNFEI